MRPVDDARVVTRGRGGRRLLSAVLGMAAIFAPGAALASTGCDAVNAGVLDFTTTFTSGSNAIDSTAIQGDVLFSASGLRSSTYTALPTNARWHPTRVAFADGETLTYTFTITGVTGTVRALFGYSNAPASPFTNTTYTSSTTQTHAVSSETEAVQTFVQRVNNADGGSVSVSVTCSGGAPAAPTIGAISPSVGAATGPASVTITGANFSASGNTVTFGGTSGVVTSQSAGALTVTPPTRSPGAVDVVVTTADARSVTASNGYTYVGAPTVAAAFSPTVVPNGTDSLLTLTLTNPNAGTALTGVGLASAALPANLTGSGAATTCPGGTATYNGGARTLSLSGGSLAAGGSCTVTLTTSSTTAGTYSYTTGAPSASGPVALSGAAATTGTPLTVAEAAPPAPVVVTPANGAVIANKTPAYAGTSGAALTINVFIDGSSIGTTTSDASGNWALTQPSALADGSHAVRATATNGGGVSPSSATHTFTVDSIAPVAPTITAPSSGDLLGDDTPDVIGAAEPNSTVTILIDGAAVGTTTADGGGSWSYTPAALSDGAHGISARATDAVGNVGPSSAVVNVTIDTTPPTAPVVTSPAEGATTGTTVAISGTSEPGTTVFVQLDGMVMLTTVYGDAGNWSVAPLLVPSGLHMLTVTSRDSAGNTSQITHRFVAAAAPVAADLPSVTVAFDSLGAAIDLSSSITGAYSTVAVATPPGHGTTSVSGDVVTYVPAAGYHGPDSFTYAATGPGGTSAPATVSIVVATPSAPVAADLSSVTVAFDSPGTAIDLSSSITGVHSSVAFVTLPGHGTASVSGDVVTYIPTAGYHGPDSFTYTATGPGGTSAPATVSIVVATPSAPVAANLSGVTVVFDSLGAAIDLSSSITGVHTSIAVVAEPEHGTVSIDGDVVTYTPVAGYHGPDSFTYAATGPGGTSAPATVGVVVAEPPPPNVSPVTVSTVGSAPGAATEVNIDLSALIQGDYDEIRIVKAPANGVLELIVSGPPAAGIAPTAAGGAVTAVYTPNEGFAGADSFDYVAEGPGGASAPATVTIEVAPLAVVAPSLTAAAGDGQTVSVDVTADATGGPFTAASVLGLSPSDAATVAVVESGAGDARRFHLEITPRARFDGVLVIRYTLSNAFGASDPATVTVTVEARPDPTLDPTIRALSDAQAETTRRFARSQVANFMRRTEQLHGGGGGGTSMGLSLMARPGVERHPLDGDPRYVIAPETELDVPANGVSAFDAPHPAGDAAPGPGFGGDGGSRPIGSVAAWTGGAIEIGRRDAARNRDEITARTSGVSVGADIRLSEALTVGLGGGYGRESSSIGEMAAHVRSESRMIAAYGSLSLPNGLFLDGVIGRGDLAFDSWRRSAETGGIALGDRDGRFSVGALAFGMDRTAGDVTWSLYGRGDLMRADLEAYAETGIERFNLRFDERRVESRTATLGARLERRMRYGAARMIPRLRVEWNREFGDADDQWLDYADIDGPAIYSVGSDGWSRDQFHLSVGNRLLLPELWTIDVDAGWRGSASDQGASLRLELSRTF